MENYVRPSVFPYAFQPLAQKYDFVQKKDTKNIFFSLCVFSYFCFSLLFHISQVVNTLEKLPRYSFIPAALFQKQTWIQNSIIGPGPGSLFVPYITVIRFLKIWILKKTVPDQTLRKLQPPDPVIRIRFLLRSVLLKIGYGSNFYRNLAWIQVKLSPIKTKINCIRIRYFFRNRI